MNEGMKLLSLDEQKAIMIEILSAFTDYCDKHSLRYHLTGGTLIGAIRHKGFIPWDDDIDIGMPLEDYKKLVSLSTQESIGEYIFFSSIETNSNHIWPMGKVISKKTKLIEPNVIAKYRRLQEEYGGVYIDIFPEYGLPENCEADHCKRITDCYQKIKRASREVIHDKSFMGLFKKATYEVAFIPYRIIGIEKYLKEINELIEVYQFSETKKVSYGSGLLKNGRDVFEREDLEEYIKAEFEGRLFNIPKGFDRMLTTQYGDYMKLPPVNERKVHLRDVTYRT